MTKGKYDEAIAAFEALDGYADSEEKILQCHYNHAASMEKLGKFGEAAIGFYHAGDYRDAKVRSKALWNQIAVRETIGAGGKSTVGLKADGTVVAVGYNDDGQCNVTGWKNIRVSKKD